MAADKKLRLDDPFTTTEKVMQTFRMSRELVTFLKGEATARGVDLTAHVVRHLEGLRTWFGLPAAAVALVEADREALGLGRYEYLLHLLFQRTLALREQPPGFDGPRAGERRKALATPARAASGARDAEPKGAVLTDRDRALLTYVGIARYASADHVHRLIAPGHSKKLVHRRLAKLCLPGGRIGQGACLRIWNRRI